MKKIIFYFAVLLLGMVITSFLMKPKDKDYTEKWKQVDEFVQKGLPRSAIQVVDQIFNEAKTEGNQPQYLKALIYRVSLQGQFQEDHLVGAINTFQTELVTAKGVEKQLIQSLLAELYYRFYMQNRWLVNERTTVEGIDNEDIHTWDAVKLNKTIATYYLESIKNQPALEEVSLADFSAILVNTEKSGFILWPSLYDLLGNRALDYFSSPDANLADFGGSLNYPAAQLFSPIKEFVQVQFPTGDSLSYQYQAAHIFQQLLAFHHTKSNSNALVDLDLKRLDFVRNNVISNKVSDSLYTASLENLYYQYQNDSVFVKIAFRLASRYQSLGYQYEPLKGDNNRWWLNKAEEICEKAIQAFPNENETNACRNLLHSIRESGFGFQVNSAGLPEKPTLAYLNFKNTTKVFFKIVKIDPAQDLEKRLNQNERDIVKNYLKLRPVQQWTQVLPDTKDHQMHATEITIPALPVGYYLIFASTDSSFNNEPDIVYNSVWITSLSYLTNNNRQTGSLEIFVLDRENGNTIPDVNLTVYERKYESRLRQYMITKIGNYSTDNQGFASVNNITDQNRNALIFTLEKSNDILHSEGYMNVYKSVSSSRTTTQTYFFTDRAIYRPGQTVYFKGIVVDKSENSVVVKPNFSTEVSFFDANRKEIAKLNVTSNEFGSFQGTFVIPRGGLNGEFRIKNQTGTARFSVEEYKRPTFKVSIDTLAGEYKLGDEVSVTGKAMNFAGSAISGANAKYRVVRAEIPIPYYLYYRPFPQAREIEIAHGNVVTELDGTFSINFVAQDDELQTGKIPFNFIVYADVTDITGEVQSAQTAITIGKDAVILVLEVPEMLQKGSVESIELKAVNLSGAPINIQAKVEVFQLTPPKRLLNNRYWSRPDINLIPEEEFIQNFPHEVYNSEDDRATWPRKKFTDSSVEIKNGATDLQKMLTANQPGEYLTIVSAINSAGDTASIEQYYTLYSPDAKLSPNNQINWNVVSKTKAEPGETIQLVIGSAAKKSRFLVEVVNGEEVIERNWVSVNDIQKTISIPVKEAYRGNFAVNVQQVRFNRFYSNSFTIEVPFTNKKLDVLLETHRDFLTPGQKEEWRVKISGPGGEKLAAELMAGMYDASLDQFQSNSWKMDLYHPKTNYAGWTSGLFRAESSKNLISRNIDYIAVNPVLYPQINWFGYESYYGGPTYRGGAVMSTVKSDAMRSGENAIEMEADGIMESKKSTEQNGDSIPPPSENFVIEQPNPLRTNFNETAFFYPQLKTDSEGNVVFTFTTPDALTEWKLMMLATSKDLKTGQMVKNFKSKKDLMIIPNVPRFVRQGDLLQFSAKVINYTDKAIQAEATIEFFDAVTMQPVDIFYNKQQPVKNVTIEAMQNEAVNWQILIPFDVNMLGYRVSAKTGSFTDGEERLIPVLTNRMLVTETMPLNVNGNETKSFNFEKLSNSDKIMMMSTRQNFRFTVEFTSNPAWYAIQALPYLSEPTIENASVLFNTYYVNALSAYIANSNPKIKNVFITWQAITPEVFYSKLQSNEELKNTLLNATPWVLEAENEAEQKRRIGILFDINRMANEQEVALKKLVETQLPGGAWPWFKGMKEDRHTTQKIILGIGKLNNKGVLNLKADQRLSTMTSQAISFLDEMIKEDYNNLKKNSPKDMNKRVPSSLQIEYLYMRSLLIDQYPLAQENMEAFDYYKNQAKKNWIKQDIYVQVMTSLALSRLDSKDESEAIMKSVLEKSLKDDEMGLYWRKESGWYWYQAPVETQALIIEALDEISNNQIAVEQAKIWLLKQKQTTHWKTNEATVEAVYALLMTGEQLLAENQLAKIKVGQYDINTALEGNRQVEAGTGYFKKSWSGDEVKAELGKIEISNPNKGIAWGGAYWQYFENLDRITQHESPLKIDKQLFIEQLKDGGPVLQPLQENQSLKPGDKVVVRLVITTDRDMEYVHVKDMRATALEPTDHLSGYSYSGGLGFYKNITDVSIDFFIQYLNKGMYLLEYPMMVTQRGEFSNGNATIQSYYAPEFTAHSEGLRLVVK